MKLSSVFVCQLLIGLAYTEFDLSKGLKDPKEQRQETTVQPKCVGPKCIAPDVVQVAISLRVFTTLLKIITDVGLVDALKKAEAVTVFAPPDFAFAKLPAGTIENLTPEQAKEIVLRHVVDSKVLAADVASGPVKLKTLGGEDIKLINRKGQILIEYEGNVITVDKADVMARNGVIHIIPTVIFPSFSKQKIEKRLEKRMKRSAISKNYGNNCGTKRGPQPRHISETNEGPKSKELAPLGRNSLAMRTKDSLINAFQKLFG